MNLNIKETVKRTLVEIGAAPDSARDLPTGVDWRFDLRRMQGRGNTKTIFDIGANIGQTAISCAKFFPEAAIHSFEPTRSTFEAGVEATRGFPNVRFHHTALGAENGEVTMLKSDVNSVFNRVVTDVSGGAGTVEKAPMVTLDSFCEREKIERIDLLKIDVEGYESAVFDGAQKMFEREAIGAIYVEVGFDPTDITHTFIGALLERMTKNGFWFHDIYEMNSLADHLRFGTPRYANLLLIEKSVRKIKSWK